MIKKVAFTMYKANDLKRAVNFYSETLGLGAYTEMGGGKWIEFDLPEGGCFAITTMAEGVEPSDSAGGSIAFEVDQIDTLVTELKNKGVTFKMEPFDSPVCRMAVALDSEGNAFMIHQLHNKK